MQVQAVESITVTIGAAAVTLSSEDVTGTMQNHSYAEVEVRGGPVSVSKLSGTTASAAGTNSRRYEPGQKFALNSAQEIKGFSVISPTNTYKGATLIVYYMV